MYCNDLFGLLLQPSLSPLSLSPPLSLPPLSLPPLSPQQPLYKRWGMQTNTDVANQVTSSDKNRIPRCEREFLIPFIYSNIYARSLQSEWLFLQRVTPNCGNLFNTIENVLSTLFIPFLLGHNCSPHERLLFSLPVRMSGLNLQNPVTTADFVYSASRSAVQFLDTTFSSLLHNFNSSHQRAILKSKDTLSSWLNTLPLQNDNFNLSAQEFREDHDAICLRYTCMKPLLNLPPTCDGCGAAFTTIHALDCRKGGLVSLRHNEICDLLCELSSIVWNNVVREPVIQESSTTLSEGLIADLAVRGVWQRQCIAMFDVRILDSDSPT